MTDARDRPRPALGPAEWKLYAVAAIAGVYLLAWRGVSRTAAPATAAAATGDASRPRAVWLEELPEAARPPLAPPPGWRVAARAEATRIAPPAAPVRAPAARPLRVRTRSS